MAEALPRFTFKNQRPFGVIHHSQKSKYKMNQIQLMSMCQSLEPEMCFQISNKEMREAASGSIKSLLFDGERGGDVQKFIAQISENWGVSVKESPYCLYWAICKRVIFEQHH